MIVLFDLDQTLVDSRIVQPYRVSRQWRQVFELVPSVAAFVGVADMLTRLNEQGHQLGVVTSSPGRYCAGVLQRCELDRFFAVTVCYHDTARHKPNADPILRALQLLGGALAQAAIVGDDDSDMLAGKNAGLLTVYAAWGAVTRPAVQFDAVCNTPADVVRLFSTR